MNKRKPTKIRQELIYRKPSQLKFKNNQFSELFAPMVFTQRAQVAAESGLADAVRAINNLATAQVRKDTPSLIDVKGVGRPKEFSGKGEGFQQWSKQTEAFFARVIKESEMMLEWAAEQATEITTTANDLEFLPTDTNVDRGVQTLGVCVTADAYNTHGSHEL